MKAGVRTGFLAAGALLLGLPGAAGAHGMVPGDLAPLEPGRVIAVMERDFLVPEGFRRLPGPVYYLSHGKALGLSRLEKERIRAIARTIMPETVRQGREIERLKKRVVRLSDGRKPLKEAELRRLLERIGEKEAMADLVHIRAHRACLHLLTPAQRARLFALLAHS